MNAAPGAATDPARQEVDDALREAARLVLGEIDAALRRIESGRYGRCRRCGDVIALERLTALPMGTWCASCSYKSAQRSAGSRTATNLTVLAADHL